MRVIIQRVSSAQVRVDSQVIAQIKTGLLLLVGFGQDDTASHLHWMARKIAHLRIFEDDAGKMNRAIQDVNGEVLAVSQFTLYADVLKGNRPSFTSAAAPAVAERMFLDFCEMLRMEGLKVQAGKFGARMEVELVNWGPVTLALESPSQ